MKVASTPSASSAARPRYTAAIATRVAGRTPLRFTHAQIYFEPDRVERILLRVAERAREMRRVHAQHQGDRQPDVDQADRQPRPWRHVVVATG